ncbi:MAG: hypothetical protein ACRDVP_12475 [Acidimicrobiales bacterium]
MVDYLLRRLVGISARRGFRGEHWAWFLAAAGFFALRRLIRKPEPVVYSRRLTAGEGLMLSLRAPGQRSGQSGARD